MQVLKPGHRSHSIPACQAAKIALQNKTIEIIDNKILLKFTVIKKGIDAIRYREEKIYIWGNGKPLRELIYCDDVADACIFFLKKKTNVC